MNTEKAERLREIAIQLRYIPFEDNGRKDLINATSKFLLSLADEVTSGEFSDGYHTFNELYEHRITLWIALCRGRSSWRTKLHSDGTAINGWFLLGIGKDKGNQITYHLPMSRWDECFFAETLERAPEFDGHTSEDVLNRIKTLANDEEKEPKSLELSDEEIKAQTDSLYYILSDSERALYTDAAEWYRSRIRVDLESFGAELMAWIFTDTHRIKLKDGQTIKDFLQSPEFEKWKQQTKTGD